MSLIQSDLSNSKYGYDIVVATTQNSINTVMKEFLNALKEPVTQVCWVADSDGNPKEIDYATLKSETGIDPFEIPANADPSTDARIQKLTEKRFMAGFQARLGIPAGYLPNELPDIVTQGSDTSQVSFKMLCNTFTIVELVPGGGYASKPTWSNIAQESGNAIIFSAKVDMRLSTVDSDEYSKLPNAIQKQIKNMGGNAFSIQQLLFDLANASLSSTLPTISGVKQGTKLYSLLEQYFMGAYLSELKKNGEPMLGANIVQPTPQTGSLTITDLDFNVNPYVGSNGQPVTNPTSQQQGLATLNYLCETNSDPFKTPSTFSWNWLEASNESDFDGVAVTNRNTFVKFFHSLLLPYAKKNCYAPNVRVWLSGILDTTVHYHWGVSGGQTPTVTTPEDGATVLSYSWTSTKASDQAGLGGDMGKLQVQNSYSMDVQFIGKRDSNNNPDGGIITITQHQVVYMYIRGTFGVDASGNILDKTITDTYTLDIKDGQITSTRTSATQDNSVNLDKGGFENFWGNDINSVTDKIKQCLENFIGTRLEDIPLCVANTYVFPGGKSFSFNNVTFSDYQDLVSEITYLNQD